MTNLEALELTSTSNPYLEFYRKFVREHPGELIEVFNPKLSEEARSKMYAALDVSVAMKYSWAIPDERALQIIKHYGPGSIVELFSPFENRRLIIFAQRLLRWGLVVGTGLGYCSFVV